MKILIKGILLLFLCFFNNFIVLSQNKNLLILVDIQNDYIKLDGRMPVKNAKKDVRRLVKWININHNNITDVLFTMNTHHINHIVHPLSWVDGDNNHPNNGDIIYLDDFIKGNYTLVDKSDSMYHATLSYLKRLNKINKGNLIWEPHTLIGSSGWSLYNEIFDCIIDNKLPHTLLEKGNDMESNVFPILIPNCVIQKGFLKIKDNLYNFLNDYDKIYFAGEAEDVCVKQCIEDINTYNPTLLTKVVILRDCMSCLGDKKDMNDFWLEMSEKGVIITNSTKINLDN